VRSVSEVIVTVTKLQFALSVLREPNPPAMSDASPVRSPVQGMRAPSGASCCFAARLLPSSVASLSAASSQQFQLYLAPRASSSEHFATFDSQQGHPCMSARKVGSSACLCSQQSAARTSG
jgi:hypothetical protein